MVDCYGTAVTAAASRPSAAGGSSLDAYCLQRQRR